MAWSMAALFFLTPFLVRHIGENGYGFYILLTTVSGFLGLMNLGLGEATLRITSYNVCYTKLLRIFLNSAASVSAVPVMPASFSYILK